ncbi:T9SS type A sorting domain-containing protein [candidate division KSB1 bacterium]|nr:T9SS type A sorting domain-containing protein [candidate division KSB1 bacterium]
MNKVTWISLFLMLVFCLSIVNAGDPIVIDQTGTDFQYYWYTGTLGKQITMDDNGKVHVAYCKTWYTETDDGYQIMYANVTDGKKLPVYSQQLTVDLQPGVIFIGGGKNGTPIYLLSGIGSRMFSYDVEMPYMAMSKVNTELDIIEPLGVQSDKNYYHNAYYANPFAMEVDEVNGICHCILTNPGGEQVSYWNFDGTNFSEVTNVIWSDPANDVPGCQIPYKYRRNATKGADLAVNSDGTEVAIATLHPFCNILLHIGELGGEVWPDDWEYGVVDGQIIALFDTTNSALGTNIANNDPKPYTDVQVKYDADNHLNVVYDATYMDVYVDTSNWYATGYFDEWMNTFTSIAGDTNAIFYDGSTHPKPQLRYWNNVTNTHTLLAECAYPAAGEEFKWFSYGLPDSGVGNWGKYLNDGPVANIELVPNLDPQEGEPKLVCVWEEMQGDVSEFIDAEASFGAYTYYAYCKDLKISAFDGTSWSAPHNLTDTADKDENEVSVYKDVVDNKIHMMYYEDSTPGSDRNDVYVDDLAANYEAISYDGSFTVPIRKATTEQVNIIYRDFDLSSISSVQPHAAALEPGGFELAQNYPNPFNPTTRISYTVPDGNVTLEIFNMLGQKIITLVDRHVTAGSYVEVWDGTDFSGKGLTSGLYLCKLTSDAGVRMSKMLLQK